MAGTDIADVGAVVVGAGFAGLYMIHRLRGHPCSSKTTS